MSSDPKNERREVIPYDNPLVQAFAGDIIDAGYPLSEEMTRIVLKKWTFERFQKQFVEWCKT